MKSYQFNGKSWIFTISQGFLGNLGVYLIHPLKLSASILQERAEAGQHMPGGGGGSLQGPRIDNWGNYGNP